MSEGSLGFKVGLDDSEFMAGMRAMQAGIHSLSSGLTSALAPIAALAAGFVGIASAASVFGKAIEEAANREQMQTAFIPLLGSAAAAQARMKELAQFAADTPFELPEVARASRVLETLTNGALSTGKGLTLVGDVASATNTPFDEVATTIGRLYDALESGRPMGETTRRLQELGAISGATVNKLEDLQKSGVKGDAAWNIASQALQRFSGGMKLQSTTWNGLLSTLHDNVNEAFEEFGEPLRDALKPAIEWLIDKTQSFAETGKGLGQALVASFEAVKEIFNEGGIGELLAGSLQMGFAKAVNFLLAQLQGVSAFLLSAMDTLPERLKAGFATLTNPQFWEGLHHILKSIGAGLVATLASGLAPIFDRLIEFIQKVSGIKIDWHSDDLIKPAKEVASSEMKVGSGMMSGAMEPAISASQKGLEMALDAYKRAVDAAPKLMDDSTPKAVSDAVAKVQEKLAAMHEEATGGSKSTAKNDAPETAGIGKTAKEALSDNYSKIGLFVGGNNPAMSETRKTNSLIGSLINATKDGNNRLVSAIADRLIDQAAVWT